MRSFFITATVATAALALGGCQDKRRPEPVPGPQSAAVPMSAARLAADEVDDSGASEISWFQGTLEEAFSRRPCHRPNRALLSF
jgi:hypothetical protein